MEVKCIITDDEPLARKGLKNYIEKLSFMKLLGECEDALQLNDLLKTQTPDLIFIDIEMPDMTGIEFLSQLKNAPKVVIVSAYEKYAIDGYAFDVVDYLLKPVSFNRFLRTANKVYDILKEKEKPMETQDFIFVKTDRRLKKINFKDLLFVESRENYVLIHSQKSRDLVYLTLKQMSELLPSQHFLQIHRSYIINTSHVQAIEGNQILVGEHQLPISRNLKENVMKRIIKQP